MAHYYGVKISKVSLDEQLKSLEGDNWVNLNQEQDNVSLCQKLEAKLEQDFDKEIKKVRLIYFPKEVDPKHTGLYFFKIPNQIYWKYTEDLNGYLTMANELKAEIEAKTKNKDSSYKQETLKKLSKEAKIYKTLFEKCIEQFEQDIACAMKINKKGNVISPKGEIIVKERFLRYIEKLKNELEKNYYEN